MASLLGQIEALRREQGFRRVTRVRLAVGALATVEIDALRFAFETMAVDGCVAGATLVIDRPAATARCRDCDACAPVRAHGQSCPHCGGTLWAPIDGDALSLVDLRVID